MLAVLSPAKKLLDWTLPYTKPTTQPLFLNRAEELAELMQNKSVAEIASLMDLSQSLAELNYQRYQDFSSKDKTYPALYFFQGDVYQGLEAKTWDEATLEYAQSHLNILSGLYGVLKPLDKIQPYRLEMGVRLPNSSGTTLYDFWQEEVTKALQKQLAKQASPILINLASQEYAKVINAKQLGYPMVTIHFYEQKQGALKMIGIHAKKARGSFAQFMMKERKDNLDGLKEFNGLGYVFHPETSDDYHLDFVRKNAATSR